MGELAEKIEVSPEAYLEMERKVETRNEYIDGCILAMGGASRRHNQIVFNLARIIGNQLENQPCAAYVSDMRVKVRETGMYAYPDLVAVCDEPRFEDAQLDALLNPSLIVEVLSASTEAYDMGEKFAHYRRLSSLSEYVLVAQDKVRVEHFLRNGEKWVLSDYIQAENEILLPSIGCRLILQDIYNKVEL